MKTLNKFRKGFTLIELLVVIAIIGILATLLLLQLNSVRSKGRDTKRVTTVTQLRDAVEQYYDDNGSYPAALSVALTGKYLANSVVVPTDPQTGAQYGYGLDSTGTKYQIWAQLENLGGSLRNDSDINGAAYTGGSQPQKGIQGGPNGAAPGEAGTGGKCTPSSAAALATDCVFDLGVQ